MQIWNSFFLIIFWRRRKRERESCCCCYIHDWLWNINLNRRRIFSIRRHIILARVAISELIFPLFLIHEKTSGKSWVFPKHTFSSIQTPINLFTRLKSSQHKHWTRLNVNGKNLMLFSLTQSLKNLNFTVFFYSCQKLPQTSVKMKIDKSKQNSFANNFACLFYKSVNNQRYSKREGVKVTLGWYLQKRFSRLLSSNFYVFFFVKSVCIP